MDMIARVKKSKLQEGVKPSTVNRMLEILRAILRKSKNEWEWLKKIPRVRLLKEEEARIRWITYEEANCLLKELPTHLSDMAHFTLTTGLRMSNVTELKWCDINLSTGNAWIHPDKAKTKKALGIPLNSAAVAILQRQLGKHEEYVFVYKGRPVSRCNTSAWKKALRRAKIENFRWHDLSTYLG